MKSFIRQTGFIGGSALVLAPLAFLGQSASAAQTCATSVPAATLIAPDVCQVSFTAAGSHTFTAPTGIAKLSALVIGAGGGATTWAGSYGGGGGEVVLIDSVDTSGSISITVGAGGAYGTDGLTDSGADGQDSSVNLTTAAGGKGATFAGGGASGNGNLGANVSDVSGGGGGSSAAATNSAGGAGTKPSSAGAGSPLFPPISGELAYGAGGSSVTGSVATPDIAGNGGNSQSSSESENGRDGAVFFRFAADGQAETLAATGSNLPAAGFAALSVAAGAALIATSRRRSQN